MIIIINDNYNLIIFPSAVNTVLLSKAVIRTLNCLTISLSRICRIFYNLHLTAYHFAHDDTLEGNNLTNSGKIPP